ncbi:hypothetical protein Mal15_53800 [Stieleria maiorica]|uniref:DUF2946 domain-containing protein n=1 Tax=Stieleria maiorica TaxID=2795974 RepID=A0A5B9MK84_9BACT|nr:hypothetical protein [Stieleria maiorica]QEG01304.1 hypothetical protein Mal15_53800 [Stieleria maiorica]
MNSLAGKTISVLLCGLVLLGQSAAWLHVATCEGGWATTQARGEHADLVVTQRDHGHPGCGHHHAHGIPSSKTSDHDSSRPAHSHDSDHCAVCQSLAWIGGTVVTESLAVTGDAFVERQLVVDAPFVESFVVSCPRLRGPPIG